MCEYQRFNPDNEKELPTCDVTNGFCTFCVLGNANTYKVAQEREGYKNGKNHSA